MKTLKHVMYCAICIVILLAIELMILVRHVWAIDRTIEQNPILVALGIVQACMHYFGKSKLFPVKYVKFMKYSTTIIALFFFIITAIFSFFMFQPPSDPFDLYTLYIVVSTAIIQIMGYIIFIVGQ